MQRRGLSGFLFDLATASWTMARVLLFTALGLGIFVVAFLGYFTLPFIFVTAAIALIGLNALLHHGARFRAWVRGRQHR